MTRGICWHQVAARFVASRTGFQSCTRALSELHMTSGPESLKAASRQLPDRTLAPVTCRREELAMQSSRRSKSITFHLSLALLLSNAQQFLGRTRRGHRELLSLCLPLLCPNPFNDCLQSRRAASRLVPEVPARQLQGPDSRIKKLVRITHVTTGGRMLVLISRSSAATGHPWPRESDGREHAYSTACHVCHVMLALYT